MNSSHDTKPVLHYLWILTLAIGVSGLFGWTFSIRQFFVIFPFQNFPMAPNTVLAHATLAIALALKLVGSRTNAKQIISNTLAVFIIAIGLATQYEYAFDHAIGIDSFFIDPVPLFGEPMRMSVYTELECIILGFAILLLDWKTKKGNWIAQYLAVIAMILPVQAILTYIYGGRKMIEFASDYFNFQMSAANATAWLALAISVLYARPKVGILSVLESKTYARRLFLQLGVPILVVHILFGWFFAYGGISKKFNSAYASSMIVVISLIFFVYIVWSNVYELYHAQLKQEKYEADIEHARAAAEVANRAKSDFIANMSHEIRSPLGVLIGFADLLSNPSCVESNKSKFIEIMKRNAKALTTIVDDVLDLSKVEAGKLNVDMQELSLVELLGDVIAVHGLIARNKGIQFTYDIQTSSPKFILADSVRIKQVLGNLLGNAIKFTNSGSVELKVSSEECRITGLTKIAFEVKDTGIGITPESLELLFKPFSQADGSITRRFGGTGLGLILSRKIAEMLGGDVELIESKVNQGSVFRFTIVTNIPTNADLLPKDQMALELASSLAKV